MKSTRKFPLVLIPAIGVAVLIFVIWQRPVVRSQSAQPDGAKAPALSQSLTGVGNSQSETAGNKIDSPASSPDTASLFASLTALVSTGANGEKRPSVAEILANPDPIKSRELAAQWNRIQAQYTDFLKLLNLSDEQVNAIEEQLLRKAATLSEILVYPPELKVMVRIDQRIFRAINTVDTSDWPQKRAIVTAASDAVVQTMLQNDAQLEAFKSYESREAARTFVSSVNSIF